MPGSATVAIRCPFTSVLSDQFTVVVYYCKFTQYFGQSTYHVNNELSARKPHSLVPRPHPLLNNEVGGVWARD